MKRIWAPWRLEYIAGKKERGCVFCNLMRRRKAAKDYVVWSGRRAIVVLNKFPYNNGHVMIVPRRHIAALAGLTDKETLEIFSLLKRAINALKKVYRPQGFNLGVNLGRAAGAGIEGHIHLHVVPRWMADSNFMPILSETRCMPQHLKTTWKRLSKAWR